MLDIFCIKELISHPDNVLSGMSPSEILETLWIVLLHTSLPPYRFSMHEVFYIMYMGVWTYHKAAHINEQHIFRSTLFAAQNTCFVLFGSSLPNSVSPFFLLLDSVPTPSAYHSYTVNQGLFAVIFLVFILCVVYFLFYFWKQFLCSNTRPTFCHPSTCQWLELELSVQ